MLPFAPPQSLELANPPGTNLVSLLEWDRQMVCPVTFRVLPLLSKCFLWTLYHMVLWDKSKRFRKRSIWRQPGKSLHSTRFQCMWWIRARCLNCLTERKNKVDAYKQYIELTYEQTCALAEALLWCDHNPPGGWVLVRKAERVTLLQSLNHIRVPLVSGDNKMTNFP